MQTTPSWRRVRPAPNWLLVPKCTASHPARGHPHQLAPQLDAAAPLTSVQLLRYERRGHLCSRRLFTSEELQFFVPHLTALLEKQRLEAFKHRLQVLCPPEVLAQQPPVTSIAQAKRLLQQHATELVGFLQVFNLHRVDELTRALVTSKRLARAAADLLAAPRVRVYQSCLFIKEPGMAETNWHSDLNMARLFEVPLDTNSFVTAWIPLRSLTGDDSALDFASGSHRDFALPYWHTDASMNAGLESRGYTIESYSTPLALGDVTWHHGWTLHYSRGQPEGRPSRVALAVSFFADGARRLPSAKRLRREPHSEDEAGCADWLQDVSPGSFARHPALPLVYGD